jgi:hypothetical protein
MKLLRTAFFSVIITVLVFSVVGYTGCKKDKCKDVSCKNGGSCAEGKCVCPFAYEGAACEKLTREKFIGTWDGTEECTSGGFTLVSVITALPDPGSVLLSNPGGYGTSETITGVVSGNNKLLFTNQPLSDGTIIDGNMVSSGSVVIFSYTHTDSSSVDSCSGTYSRKQ